jgi:pyruvyltransferase
VGQTVKVYYWKSVPNFGDLINPYILKRFTRLEAEWAEPVDAELVICGSVIDRLGTDWTGVIAGAGKLHEHTRVPPATILALRGPLTANGIKGDFALGDPGLLANELVKPEDKRYDLGIVSHWTDKSLEFNPTFTKYNPHIIRVGDDPLEVIREIGRCKKIVSSSLHGIILADAFGIPRRIEIAPRMTSHPHQEGGLFKWHDYSESIGMKLEIGLTQSAPVFNVSQRQHELYDALRRLRVVFRNGKKA